MVTIVYWSGTGNTEAMAEAVAEGVRQGGGEVTLLNVSEADESVLDSAVVLFGCPAMGAEELEDGEFEPYFAGLEDKLAGKKVGLFGSYEWAEGEWMRTWQARCEADGANMIADGLIAYSTPDNEAIEKCVALGKLAASL